MLSTLNILFLGDQFRHQILNAKCYAQIDGSLECSCDSGFELKYSNVTKTQFCQDIDECGLNASTCGLGGKCLNVDGSYTCVCLPGFLPNFHTVPITCQDLDECSSECLNNCDINTQVCVNLEGSHECNCKSGFMKSDTAQCEDIKECLNFECGVNSVCLNTFGGFECRCKTGFYLSNQTFCEDINECVDANMNFECFDKHNSICANTIGSFYCFCGKGMLRNISGDCIDIDECRENKNACELEKGEVCINTISSYFCECKQGYAWSEVTQQCQDINECELLSSDSNDLVCKSNSICINLNGSFKCECKTGWRSTIDSNDCLGNKND